MCFARDSKHTITLETNLHGVGIGVLQDVIRHLFCLFHIGCKTFAQLV